MLTQQRKVHILATLKRDGQVVAKTISLSLGLSEDTIRRDLRELAAEGLLQRVHGGALPASPGVAKLAARKAIAADEKAKLAKRAAAMIENGQVVIIDGGTTNLQLVNALSPDLRATIITHSPSIAVALADHESIEVIIIGGKLFRHSMVTTGAIAIETIRRLRADLYVMGVTGIHPEEGLTTADMEEAAIKSALMSRAAETLVIASTEKLGAVSPFSIAAVNEISSLVVSETAPSDILDQIEQQGVSIIRA
jgi:DeoR/GlpR family transcriptional regulator of sugar metabolism